MARMRTVVRTGLITASLALLAPAGARAGTYDVVSCRAPGAGGINAAWKVGYGALDPTPTPEHFDVVQECPGPHTFLLARSKGQDGVDAFWAHSAFFRIDAPPRTAISRIRIWRHGQTVRADATDGGGEEWDVFAQTDDGNLAEGCPVPDGQAACNVGAPEPLDGNGLSNASLATYNLDTAWASWGVTCNPAGFKSCATANGVGYPYGSFNLWGSIVTIRDDEKPALAASGGLWSDGWRRPTEPLGPIPPASDNAGLRSVRARVGSVTAIADGNCDFHRTTPCATQLSGSLALGAAPPDGPQPSVVTAVDAAGNETSAARTVNIDGNAPRVDLRAPRGRTIVVRAQRTTHPGSPPARSRCGRRQEEPHRPLPTTYRRGTLRARLDRGRPGKWTSSSRFVTTSATSSPAPRLGSTSPA